MKKIIYTIFAFVSLSLGLNNKASAEDAMTCLNDFNYAYNAILGEYRDELWQATTDAFADLPMIYLNALADEFNAPLEGSEIPGNISGASKIRDAVGLINTLETANAQIKQSETNFNQGCDIIGSIFDDCMANAYGS